MGCISRDNSARARGNAELPIDLRPDTRGQVASFLLCTSAVSLSAQCKVYCSGFQIPFFEFLRCCAVLAEVVNGRAYRREGEWLKRFGEHFVEVFPGGEAGGDVRIEMLAGRLRNELRNVLD